MEKRRASIVFGLLTITALAGGCGESVADPTSYVGPPSYVGTYTGTVDVRDVASSMVTDDADSTLDIRFGNSVVQARLVHVYDLSFSGGQASGTIEEQRVTSNGSRASVLLIQGAWDES